ncbi:hypothetical protein SADUNF_Sadunf03G0010600 [Salix dunnii]|uniref:UDP-glucose:glycoprotein glucosyltransferase n=1 Tax=Salix dunnii TaxID=1413687 RepID=A0A835KD94_9ROSI|nr:hypothetical protein SADUNF_Sadunf03G0010600 [Salix dunnii]
METRFRSGSCALVILVCVVGFCGFGSVSCGDNRRPKNVQVAIRAKWEGTPILLEAGYICSFFLELLFCLGNLELMFSSRPLLRKEVDGGLETPITCESQDVVVRELLSKERKDIYWEFIDSWLHSKKEDNDSYTAKECLKKIIKHGHALLSDTLASLFEFSLILRSASPRLVLYRQLAEESLSSFPLLDDSFSNNASGGLAETNENNGMKRSDPLLVGRNPESPGGKCCWVDTGAALFYDVADLLLWLHSPTGMAGDSFQQPELFDFDHVHFESLSGSPVTILYGALGTECFKVFHSALVEAAKQGKVKYVVRPVLPSGCESKVGQCVAVGASGALNLGGYGVELALKNMEYKAMDDSAIKKGVTLEDPRTEDLSQEERKPELTSEIMAFRDYLLSSTISDTLDVWELKDLGHQTAQRIVHASDPLQSMQEINQNFPSVVSSLSRMKLDDSVKDEITANQRMIPPSKSLMALNGALINIEDIDLYLLVDMVQQELSLADQFSKLKFLTLPMGNWAQSADHTSHNLGVLETSIVPHSTIRKLLLTVSPPESNMIRVDFRSSHVHYLNNLEEDAMYKRWRNNINEILMPVFPGQLRYIRKNLFHAVYSVDMILSLYENNLPMRFGLILYSSKFIKKTTIHGLHLSAKDIDGETEDISSLVNRLRMLSDSADDGPETHHVEEAFVETILPKVKSPPQDILLKLAKEQTYKELSQESSLFVFKLGLNKLECCLLMNGLVFDSSEEVLMNAMNDELPRIQEQVYYGHINSHTDVLDKFLSESGISRYNPQIIAEGKAKPRFISLTSGVLGGESVVNDINFLHSSGNNENSSVHIDAVVDPLSATGQKVSSLLRVLRKYVQPSMRIVLNPMVSQFFYLLLGLESGVNAVITNGRVMFPGDEGTFLSHDLHLLETMEFKQRVKHIGEIIEEVQWQDVDPDMLTSKFVSDIIMYVSSAMATRERSSESARFEILNAEHSAVIIDNENSSVHIDAVVDPLSATGQKVSSLLRVLRKYVQPSMRIVLNPMSSLVDLPLKNYYRYVVPTMDDFSSTDLTVNGPKAFFANMPLSKTLTMNLDVPEPWLVEPVIAVHDVDNILLENLGDTRTLQAVFELEALVLTGHCSEKDHEPPRGLQLILGTKNNPHLVDTLVMANLGYWQMKVSPGVWYLQLAPGRSSELYAFKEDGDGNQEKHLSKLITINDLRGKVVHLEVVKKKGMEREKLLISIDDENNSQRKGTRDSWNSNLFKWASGFIGSSGLSKKNESALMAMNWFSNQEHEKSGRHGKTINIFSIASGHLYERFLKIMILSVWKNTQRPVKFWFIKNYLSPQFKDVIPHMAQEYGFEYELITYKWPSWLHKQTEKQRIIWAYKILFLDVIFPLSLERVIFVDADQVVRADMGELYDMDIKGRPLAYTPFCDNNRDMDGYRFWSQGFWKEHLRGRPYHISALYIVDLVKFRETAAGDNLRVFYETLSKDPNSLANLDQDLPNYAQHTVPIFSLPQEWLWCESWCGNATKSRAKTIDLCNNPMTKEPKLQGAKRIVSEWVNLDSEARQFTAKILGDEVNPQELVSPNQPQDSLTDNSLEEDVESKAEL